MIIKILNKLCNNKTIFSFIIKKILNKLTFLKSSLQVELNISNRPNYAYCLFHAAKLAKKLNYKAFSVIEFGVAGGNGLYFIENFANKISKELDINIEVYGFTLENGLSTPDGYKDLPYWFAQGYFSTDKEKLFNKVKKSKIIFGDVKETTKDFFKKYNPAPLGVVFNDLDYFSSTLNSFNIFNSETKNYLPRIFCYFDDIIGSENEMYGEFTGELAAINEFNKINGNKKIFLNQNLVCQSNEVWRYQIYYYHNFIHEKYNDFIGEEEQLRGNQDLALKK
jgi:hypothetical protein